MVLTGRQVWRDFVTDGVPSSGKNDPKKIDIRNWAYWLESLITAVSAGGGKLYSSRAALNADLSPAANTPALVIGDPTAANNGLYVKIGASGSGSWARVGDVPGYQFIRAENLGTGTPNAIVATSALPVSNDVLVLLPIVATNTSTPVTVSFNGGPALTIKTVSGSDIAPGGLVSGMVALGYVSGSSFRLVSDQASAAIIATAQAAADVAVAAANSQLVFNTVSAFTSASISNVVQSVQVLGFYAPGDNGGHRKYRISTPSPVQPWHSQSGDGAWWEIREKEVTPQMFGAKADATNIGVGTDDTAAIEKWKQYLAAKPLTVGLVRGIYRYNPTSAWDVSARNDGYSILGRSKNGDGFYLDAGKTLAIETVNGFYHRFEHIHIRANVAGPALRIGKNDYSDAFNSSTFILVVNNDSLDDAAEGTRLNYVLQSEINLVSNCGGTGRPGQSTTPGHGKAIVIRQACFNTFHIAGGQANVAVYLTNGFIFANTFVSFDCEEVAVGIRCDSANAARNDFSAGQVVATTTYDFTAGNSNVIREAVNGQFYSGGALGSNLIGVEIERLAFPAHLSDPTMPASTVYWKNTSGSKVQIVVFAGNVSLIQVKSSDGGVKNFNPQVAGEGTTIILPPNWEIAFTYTSAPAWRHFPV
ncbi:MAG: hypothetical protein PGN22_02135 [Agrobacterium cavarae]